MKVIKTIKTTKATKKRIMILSVFMMLLLCCACSCAGNSKETANGKISASSSGVSDNHSSSKEENIYDSTEAFDYREVDGGVSIDLFKNDDYIEYDKIIIPSEIEGKTVVGIGNLDHSSRAMGAVFGNCEVVVPDTVTYIGQYAFSDAKGLVKLSGGKNCKTIGKHAFFNCKNLTEVTFIDTVTDVADDAFAGCTKWEAAH